MWEWSGREDLNPRNLPHRCEVARGTNIGAEAQELHAVMPRSVGSLGPCDHFVRLIPDETT